MPGGDRVHRVVDRAVRRAGAEHEDRAGAVPGADQDVLRAGRAVQVVPPAQPPLLALDHRDALAVEHEEAFLVTLGVVPAVGLAGHDDVDVGPELGEPCVLRLERAPRPGAGQPCPARLREIEDEPALALHDPARLGFLDLRLVHLYLRTWSGDQRPGACRGRLVGRSSAP